MRQRDEMTASKAKKLSPLFRSAKTSLPSSQDPTLKQIVSSLDTSSPITPKQRRSTKSPKMRSPSKNSASKAVSYFSAGTLRPHSGGTSLDTVISPDSPEVNDDKYLETFLEMPWFSIMSHNYISLHREEVSRDRKQKWVFQNTQNHGFDRQVRMCAQTLGADATIHVFGKLGRETRVKEYNALIGLCIEKARITEDEQVSLQQIYKAYQLFLEQGFRLEEETFGPFLIFLIDMEKLIDKIKELCDYIAAAADGTKPTLKIPTSGIRASSAAFRNKNSAMFETAQKSYCSKSDFEHTRSKGSTRGVQKYKADTQRRPDAPSRASGSWHSRHAPTRVVQAPGAWSQSHPRAPRADEGRRRVGRQRVSTHVPGTRAGRVSVPRRQHVATRHQRDATCPSTKRSRSSPRGSQVSATWPSTSPERGQLSVTRQQRYATCLPRQPEAGRDPVLRDNGAAAGGRTQCFAAKVQPQI
ncbi:hypothetical protein HYC85_014744 [Camellia sinensis]|uniref:Uncharacterized protein n=1 Tax=Camellia sinensis TaxID=4442 RepID=A0A7J7H894_CAMSI|nr:hypothetical protein HYC85_014744 [Camellia sinensis]